MSSSYPTKLCLAMKSGNICAFEGCRKPLSLESSTHGPSVIGEAAHIYGENPGTDQKPPSARYREDMTDEERNHYNNLIYLCPTCHTIIDKQEQDYPAENLFKMKEKHEVWVSQRLDDGMSEVTFAELQIAASAIASGKHSGNSDYQVPPIEEKIQKNNLSSESHTYIAMGLSRASEVKKFLSEMSQLDDQFSTRLKNGFKQKYLELKCSLSGDGLFMGMMEYAQLGLRDFKQKAASLALLSYLFHLCEVFEK